MKSISIHNLDAQLEKKIGEFAKVNNLSLNKAIQVLLKKVFKLEIQNNLKINEFEEFLGVWDKKENDQFKKNVVVFSKVNRKDWN